MLYSIRRTMQMIFVDIGRDTPTILENIHCFLQRNLENHPANRCFCKNRFFQDDTAWSQTTHIYQTLDGWNDMPLWRLVLPQLLTQLSLKQLPSTHQVHAQPNRYTFSSHAWHLALKEISESILGSDIFWVSGGGEQPAPQENLDELHIDLPSIRELGCKVSYRAGVGVKGLKNSHIQPINLKSNKTKNVHEWEWGFMIFHGSAKTLVAPRYTYT